MGWCSPSFTRSSKLSRCRSLALSLILLAFMATRARTVERALMPLVLASSFAYVVLEIRFLISLTPSRSISARRVGFVENISLNSFCRVLHFSCAAGRSVADVPGGGTMPRASAVMRASAESAIRWVPTGDGDSKEYSVSGLLSSHSICLSLSTTLRPLPSISYPRVHRVRTPGTEERRESFWSRLTRNAGRLATAVFQTCVVLSALSSGTSAFEADRGVGGGRRGDGPIRSG